MKRLLFLILFLVFISCGNSFGWNGSAWDSSLGRNETYGSGWNSDINPPEKDDIYDYLHQIDTNDDGVADNLSIGAASESAAGISELATDAETVTGTATDKVTTPANITARLASPGTIGGTTPSPNVNADAIAITRSATVPQIYRFWEATGDGDNYTDLSQWPLTTGATGNGTIYLPDVGALNGVVRVLVTQSTTQTVSSTTAETAVTGTSVTCAANTFRAGKSLVWEGCGVITGANDTKIIGIYIGDSAQCVITIAAAIVGNYSFKFTLSEETDLAHQNCYGQVMYSADGATAGACIVAVDLDGTHDFASETTVNLKIKTTNATDDMTVETVKTYLEEYH